MKLRTLILLVLIAPLSQAQDFRFSQFNENPLLLNPALAGATHKVRASISYRNQWRSVSTPFKTIGASLDMILGKGRRKRTGKFGYSNRKNISLWAAGVSVYRDRAGTGQLSTTNVNLSISYRIATGQRAFLSAGMQAAWVQKNFDQTVYVFPNQYNGIGYDASMASNENFAAPRGSYFDAGAGALWTYGQDSKTFDTHREFKFMIGGAAYHVMEPSEEYLANGNARVDMRYTAHMSVLFSVLPTRFSLAPSGMFQMQGPHQELIAGIMARYYLDNSTNYTGYVKRTTLGLGGYYRNGDAIVVNLLIELQEQYAFGFAYDINYSGLNKASSNRGGYEIMLRYSPPRSFLYANR